MVPEIDTWISAGKLTVTRDKNVYCRVRSPKNAIAPDLAEVAKILINAEEQGACFEALDAG